tara:strand:+ start:134705 stop:135919 length:1215 start_codon:yes stop_codon:yes gene_type:complete
VITKNPMTAAERRAVLSLALLYNVRMLGLFMVLPLLALYAADYRGATPALIGLALGIYGLSQALLQVPLGWLSDRIGRKPVIVGGLLVFALGSLLAAWSESIHGIVLGRLLQGAGAIASSIMALVADLTSDEQRTKAMAIVGASIGLAFAVALVVGPLLAAFGGLDLVFAITAVLAVLGMLVLWRIPEPESGQTVESAAPRGNLFGRALRDPALLRLDAGIFTLHCVLMALFLVLPGLIEGLAGVPRDQHWQVYLPVILLSVLGVLPMMRLAERGGRPAPVFLAAILALVVALVALGLAASGWTIYLAAWLFFVGFNYLEATLPSMVSKAVFPGGRGTALGIYSTAQFLGIFAGGALGGWLLQHYGSQSVLLFCVGLCGLWCLLALPRHGQRAAAEEALTSKAR